VLVPALLGTVTIYFKARKQAANHLGAAAWHSQRGRTVAEHSLRGLGKLSLFTQSTYIKPKVKTFILLKCPCAHQNQTRLASCLLCLVVRGTFKGLGETIGVFTRC